MTELPNLIGHFAVLRNGQVEHYTQIKDIPASFENLIQFKPDYPPEPHTPEQHAMIAQFSSVLVALMSRETN